VIFAATCVAMAVALSLVVFEVKEWVDALCANALLYSEPSTVMVLHLNAAVNYSSATIVQWNSSNPRVGVGAHRVPVQWGRGGILYAHLINAEHAVARWPHVRYFVLQVSSPRLLPYSDGVSRASPFIVLTLHAGE